MLERSLEHLGRARARVRRPARQQLIQRGAERIDIAPRAGLVAADLLGCHEAGRAEHRADLRLQAVRGRRDLERCARVRIVLADHLREAPVDHHGLAELADEDVRGLEVAVDHAAAVRVGHGVDRGEHVRQQHESLGEVRGALDELVERATGHAPHHVERPAIGSGARVVERNDRGVLETRRDLDLAREPLLDAFALRQHFLQRDGAAELRIERFDHAPHAAAPELGAEPVALVRRNGSARRAHRIAIEIGRRLARRDGVIEPVSLA